METAQMRLDMDELTKLFFGKFWKTFMTRFEDELAIKECRNKLKNEL